MEEQVEEHIAVSGATLWTVRQGRGPALALCHGGPGLWDHLAPVAAMVDDLATVYHYDQRACGRSTGAPPHDVAAAITDLDALRAHWGIAEWIVAGHSWDASLMLL
jgi:proline iminopeptidase